MPRAPKPQPRDGELPDEFALRKLVAKAKLQSAKAAIKASGLSTYAAADKGRRNRDWKSNNGSADLAIIPDRLVLIGRARQLIRDSCYGKSMQRAFTRNVVGKGITVVPHAKDAEGQPLTSLNQRVRREWEAWGKSKLCDVERRKTFGQMQRLAAKEKFAAGEHLWMWSYQQGNNASMPIGFSLQAFEPEQFDDRILSYEGREVRGGIEVDQNGAPVAAHLYTRNPNDVLYRHAFFSERVPMTRLFHYFESDRVLQTHGVTAMTPVMQDVRDLERGKGAHLTRWLMEACIGAIVKTAMPITGPQGSVSTLIPAVGDPGKTDSGMTEADFVPGMVANLQPGEDIVPFMPTSPGGQYEPFTTLTVRGIGAGVGMSYGQVMRQSDGNYSSARQDMLEDRKEWEPEQELLVDDLVSPTYRKWYSFMAHEGRFDAVDGFSYAEYIADPNRFVEADFIPPPQTWIDPEKEANGWILLLKNRLITREEIAAMRGTQFFPTLRKIAAEFAEAEDEGLTFPENEADRASARELMKGILMNKLGTIDSVMANITDFRALADAAGIKTLAGKDIPVQPILPVVSPPGQLATGDPVLNKEGEIIGGGVEAPPTPPPVASGTPGAANPSGKTPNNTATALAAIATDGLYNQARDEANADEFQQPTIPVPPEVPNYKPAADKVISCASCSFLTGERCTRFGFTVDPAKVCDDWRAATITENIGAPNTAKSFPPGKLPGERDLESRFYPDADPASQVV